MNWRELNTIELIDEILKKSDDERVMIFKFHTNRIVDILVRGLLERDWYSGEMGMDKYFLDVTENPEVTEKADKLLELSKDTPQIVIIQGGKCIYSAAAGDIYYNKIREYSNVLKLAS